MQIKDVPKRLIGQSSIQRHHAFDVRRGIHENSRRVSPPQLGPRFGSRVGVCLDLADTKSRFSGHVRHHDLSAQTVL